MDQEKAREEREIDACLEEEKNNPPQLDGIPGDSTNDHLLRCRSIRIGSYRIYPFNNMPHLHVNMSTEGLSFAVPVSYDKNHCVNINLKSQDITKVLVHYGRCLPIMFVSTTPGFGQTVRDALRLTSVYDCYFDPASNDDTVQKITFLIDYFTSEQHHFIRHCFLGDDKVEEMDQKEANGMLLKSTPRR